MVDVVDIKTRSKIMSAIKGKNTQPEMAVRRYLHSIGFRYRLHQKGLPGKPDLVLKKYNVVIFVHGCFWHRHQNCFYAINPASRTEFWQAKLDNNVARDKLQVSHLLSLGWRVLVVWECGLKHDFNKLAEVSEFVVGDNFFMIWPKNPPRGRMTEFVEL